MIKLNNKLTASILVLSIFLSGFVQAQQDKNASDEMKLISYRVLLGDVGEMDQAGRDFIEHEFSAFLNENKLSAEDKMSPFVWLISGKLINKESTISMPTVVTLSYKLNLKVLDLRLGVIFNEESVVLKGEGPNDNSALVSALSTYDFKENRTKARLEDAASTAAEHYINHCEEVLMKAEEKRATNAYAVAFSMVYNIPFPAEECKKNALNQMKEWYGFYMDEKCIEYSNMVLELIELKEMDEALKQFKLMIKHGECSEQAKDIIKKLEEKNDTKSLETFNAAIKKAGKRKELSDEILLERVEEIITLDEEKSHQLMMTDQEDLHTHFMQN